MVSKVRLDFIAQRKPSCNSFRKKQPAEVVLEDYPPISVVIPAYNAEKHLGHAIESIQSSDYPFREIIVVDDASTDQTAKIAESYHVTLIRHKKKQGFLQQLVTREL